MPTSDKAIYLGFDPGGERKFGVALVSGRSIVTSTVSSVDDAMCWAVRQRESRQPIAAGIDTLLHWATSKGGWRACDWQLRKRYWSMSNSVISPNGLYGAMAIGGMALAFRLRQTWPEIILNETHPKVLLYAKSGLRYDPKCPPTIEVAIQWFVTKGEYVEAKIEGEHALERGSEHS
jgi:predicted nuclease with RNAse H fold